MRRRRDSSPPSSLTRARTRRCIKPPRFTAHPRKFSLEIQYTARGCDIIAIGLLRNITPMPTLTMKAQMRLECPHNFYRNNKKANQFISTTPCNNNTAVAKRCRHLLSTRLTALNGTGNVLLLHAIHCKSAAHSCADTVYDDRLYVHGCCSCTTLNFVHSHV